MFEQSDLSSFYCTNNVFTHYTLSVKDNTIKIDKNGLVPFLQLVIYISIKLIFIKKRKGCNYVSIDFKSDQEIIKNWKTNFLIHFLFAYIMIFQGRIFSSLSIFILCTKNSRNVTGKYIDIVINWFSYRLHWPRSLMLKTPSRIIIYIIKTSLKFKRRYVEADWENYCYRKCSLTWPEYNIRWQ